MAVDTERFEDTIRLEKDERFTEHFSKYCDFRYYDSSVTPGLRLAVEVYKPEKPGYLLVGTHGWHMTLEEWKANDTAPRGEYLYINVDMRGRPFSSGKQDCNGYELHDVYDAIDFVKKEYAAYILDPEIVFFEDGSGGGGNAFELVNKFPDLFSAVTAMCGISDYADWYRRDEIGEFRDEMDVWLGADPDAKPEAYRSRSGIDAVGNLLSPIFIAHGETDERVPVTHSRAYVLAAKAQGKGDLVTYYEMPGVGTRAHFGRATEEQMKTMERLSEENRRKHLAPVTIPARGSFRVHGYLVTKHFRVYLKSVDAIAQCDYDLASGSVRVTPESAVARIEFMA